MTMEHRVRSHIQQCFKKGGRRRLYKKSRELGVHRMVWTPLHWWPGESTKYQRLFVEGTHIWVRSASLNAIGAHAWEQRVRHDGELLHRDRRRRRLVKPIMEKEIARENGETEK